MRFAVVATLFLWALLWAAPSWAACDPSETDCGNYCCSPPIGYCCSGSCGDTADCGRGDTGVLTCPLGQVKLTATCGGDPCGCSVTCAQNSDCASGCCSSGRCANICVCNGEGSLTTCAPTGGGTSSGT